MSILQNALDSIAIGLEDFESTDDRRIISSTRNVFAGILLLFKHKLCELSPAGSEALIKQRILPELDAMGEVIWVGKGDKTVDVQNIKDRFKSLKISVDWKRLDEINRYRNDIEHYYSTKNHSAVQKLISDSFIIIRDFIVDELGDNPRELLGEKSWKTLVDTNEVYEKEKLECNETIEKLSFYSDEICNALIDYHCDECGSGLLEAAGYGDAVDATFTCRACGNQTDYYDIVNEAVDEFYAGDAYLAVKDGGDAPVVDCPMCGTGAYIVHEGICVSCGDSASHECARCGSDIPPEELSDGDLCRYCAHMVEKVMAE